jgi:hypothetical protein
MGKAAEIVVDVKAKLDVDRKTAETCLRLIEFYVNANGVNIIVHKNDDGELSFEFEEKLNLDMPKITPETAEAIAAMGERHTQETVGGWCDNG